MARRDEGPSILIKAGFEVDDTLLTTREEVDAFQAAHGVDTTPQTFIDGNRIGNDRKSLDDRNIYQHIINS